MGSGKSTIGPKLAGLLALPFFDLDDEIEIAQGRSIPQIFESDNGSDAFRKIESRMLEFMIAEHPHFVLATGGGTPLYHDGISKMKDSGIVVYLRLPVATIRQRIVSARKERPLVAGIPKGSLAEVITNQLEERRPVYESAHIIADVLKETVQELSEKIRQHAFADNTQ